MKSKDIFWHAKFTRAYERALLYFLELQEGHVLLLTGASGVGKSEITEILENKHNVTNDRKHIHDISPVVRISANPYQDGGFFSIKDMWWGALHKIDHVLVNGGRTQRNIPASELAFAFQESLLAMNTRYLIIDEAQHMREVRGGDRNARRILDALKSFASAAEVVLVLSGAYPLLGTVDLGPQLSRRTHTIVMHRYYSDRSGDLAEFSQIVKWCADVRGLDYRAYIEPLLPEIYLGTLGVFGMVEGLMLEIKLQIGERNLKKPDKQFVASILEKLPVKDSIREEIEEGEEYLSRRAGNRKSESVRRPAGCVVEGKNKPRKKKSRRAKNFGKSSVFE